MKSYILKNRVSVHSLLAIIFTVGLLAMSSVSQASDTDPSVEAKKSHKAAHTQAAPAVSAVNINKADVQTLAQLNGVGEKRAQAIVAYRESKGGFKSVDDLLNVKGVGEKILEKNRGLLSVN